MAREISIIPSKLQIPVMVVLAVVFVLLLVRQSKKLSARRASMGNDARVVEAAPVGEAAAPKVSLEDVRELMKEIQSAAVESHEAVTEPPPLIRDPFHLRVLPVRPVEAVVPEAAAGESAPSPDRAEDAPGEGGAGEDAGATPETGSAAAAPDAEPADPEPDGLAAQQARLRFLASLSLSATCIVENGAVALVNGRIMRQGDTVGDFTLKAIRARDIVLEDDAGAVIVRIQEGPIP